MSQFEVLCVLKEAAQTSKPWMCTHEIADETGSGIRAVQTKVWKLLQDGRIKARFNPKNGSREYRAYTG